MFYSNGCFSISEPLIGSGCCFNHTFLWAGAHGPITYYLPGLAYRQGIIFVRINELPPRGPSFRLHPIWGQLSAGNKIELRLPGKEIRPKVALNPPSENTAHSAPIGEKGK